MVTINSGITMSSQFVFTFNDRKVDDGSQNNVSNFDGIVFS
jgi:hypothetical protein